MFKNQLTNVKSVLGLWSISGTIKHKILFRKSWNEKIHKWKSKFHLEFDRAVWKTNNIALYIFTDSYETNELCALSAIVCTVFLSSSKPCISSLQNRVCRPQYSICCPQYTVSCPQNSIGCPQNDLHWRKSIPIIVFLGNFCIFVKSQLRKQIMNLTLMSNTAHPLLLLGSPSASGCWRRWRPCCCCSRSPRRWSRWTQTPGRRASLRSPWSSSCCLTVSNSLSSCCLPVSSSP